MRGINGRCLVDTNILIYATLSSDDRFSIAQNILLKSKKADLCISVQNLAEMYPNLTGPKMKVSDDASTAHAKIESIASLDHLTVFPITLSIIQEALKICSQYNITRQNYFDAQLAATMLINNISTIITENEKDFRLYKNIKVVNPF